MSESTEYIVIRPAEDLTEEQFPTTFDGEWRKRSELEDESQLEIPGITGTLRAYPIDKIELSAAGDRGQVYEARAEES
jgi:hypothetical protein